MFHLGIHSSGEGRDQTSLGPVTYGYVPPQPQASNQTYAGRADNLFQTTTTRLSDKMQNKLNQLEKLQYQLTKEVCIQWRIQGGG